MTTRSRWHGSFSVAISLVLCVSMADAWPNAQSTLPDTPSVSICRANRRCRGEAANQDSLPSKAAGFQSREPALRGVAGRLIRDQGDIYTAPFHKSALKWDVGLPAVAAGLIFVDPEASRQFSDTRRTPSLRISDVGLYGTMGTVGVFYLSGAMTDNAHAKETGLLGAEALANTAITYTLIKTATGRERPLVGNGNGRFWHYNRLGSSFPSGHASLTWAGATVIAHEYPKRWVQVLAYGSATAVAFTRYSGRAHFPSDVVVGSAIGYLIGSHIFNTNHKKTSPPVPISTGADSNWGTRDHP